MYNNPPSYLKLARQTPDAEEQEAFLPSDHFNPIKVHNSKWRRAAILSFVANFLLMVAIVSRHFTKDVTNPHCELMYSPANEAIEYKNVVFHTSFWDNDPSEYQKPPSPETNALWDDLYGFGVSTISKEEAVPMMNKTDKLLVAEEPQYITELAVFHQLHCLNTIRMALSPDDFPDRKEFLEPDHISHCIDSIRQSLQCSSDVTPLPWQWIPELQEYRGRLGIPHRCRNFDKIRDWARPRELKSKIDKTTYVAED